MKRLFYILLAGLLFVACADDINEEVTIGKISGVVSDKTTGEPVATVSAVLSPGGNSTVTGSDGSFEFVDLSPGEYTININKEGYKDNSKAVTVTAGQTTQAHLLIERIPAVITADRTELDFGDSYSVNTLSFNIVNNNYEKLSWEMVNNCGWITDVSPKSGTLAHGKTGTIIVKINRDLLADGENTTVLVLSTEGVGSTEITVKAYGTARVKATLNTLEASSVTASTATLSGEIISGGYPQYHERGIVLGEQPMPTVEQTLQRLTATITNDKTYSCQAVGLTLGKTYYVRAYAVNEVGTAYSSNQVSFTTTAIIGKAKITGVSGISLSNNSAVVHGEVLEVGDPAYSERGFAYSHTNSSPTIYNEVVTVEGSGKGTFDAKLTDLERESTYYVRAYLKNEAGIAYSDSTITFSTKTILGKAAVTRVDEINLSDHTAMVYGEVLELGDPAYSERGFVYSRINSSPTIYNSVVTVDGSGKGIFEGKLTDLEHESTYYVRAYVKNDAGVAYSENTITFSTMTILGKATVTRVDEINLSDHTAIAYGEVLELGDPAYTECGFVYSHTNSSPTIHNSVVTVENRGKGAFDAKLTDLERESTYYVRAYVKNDAGVAYSENTITFSTEETLPTVRTLAATDLDESSHSAVLHGNIVAVGNPSYTERGFVYSHEYSTPTINDTKIVVNGSETGDFEARVSGLSREYSTYVRAYATNSKGTVYGGTIELFVPDFIVVPELGIMVQREDLGCGDYYPMEDLCGNSVVGGFTDWRLPTKAEMSALYNLRHEIGGFGSRYYWVQSSSYIFYFFNMTNGSSSYCQKQNGINGYARAVRTLTK